MLITITLDVADDLTRLNKIYFTPTNLKVETVKGLLQASVEGLQQELDTFGNGLDFLNVAKTIIAQENKKAGN